MSLKSDTEAFLAKGGHVEIVPAKKRRGKHDVKWHGIQGLPVQAKIIQPVDKGVNMDQKHLDNLEDDYIKDLFLCNKDLMAALIDTFRASAFKTIPAPVFGMTAPEQNMSCFIVNTIIEMTKDELDSIGDTDG